MRSPDPILVSGLFPEVRQHLLSLLNGFTPEDWRQPTASRKWTVKDVALHLLGGDIGNLSRRRDKHAPADKAISDWQDLVRFLNDLNQSWVTAARRMSPRVLCDLLAHTGPQVEQYFASLDPFAAGTVVSWAGPDPAPQWLDIAREYTEQWHHQQQIRDATGRAGLYEPRLFLPVLDTFVRALPHTFRGVDAEEGTFVQLTISGLDDGNWVLRRKTSAWELLVGRSSGAAAHVTLDAKDAWKIFTRGIRDEEARQRAVVSGQAALGLKVLEMVSVIA
jgi:uncharacterized protein (TIGR03083 family)